MVELGKTYIFKKKYELLSTDGSSVDYKGRKLKVTSPRDLYITFVECTVEGSDLPNLFSKKDLDELLSKGALEEVETS